MGGIAWLKLRLCVCVCILYECVGVSYMSVWVGENRWCLQCSTTLQEAVDGRTHPDTHPHTHESTMITESTLPLESSFGEFSPVIHRPTSSSHTPAPEGETTTVRACPRRKPRQHLKAELMVNEHTCNSSSHTDCVRLRLSEMCVCVCVCEHSKGHCQRGGGRRACLGYLFNMMFNSDEMAFFVILSGGGDFLRSTHRLDVICIWSDTVRFGACERQTEASGLVSYKPRINFRTAPLNEQGTKVMNCSPVCVCVCM